MRGESRHESGVDGRTATLSVAASHAGLVVVETGGGFEGERFVDDLVDMLVQQHSLARFEVVELIDPDDLESNLHPAVALIRAPLVAGLRGWADSVMARHHDAKPTIVVLPPGVSGLALQREAVPTVLVDHAALQMTAADVACYARTETRRDQTRRQSPNDELDEGVAELITATSGGWPAWVATCVPLLDASAGAQANTLTTSFTAGFRRRAVEGHFQPFAANDVATMAQLAHFQTFSAEVATALGGLDFAETVLPHAPGLMRTPDGLLRFVDPVHRYLTGRFKLEPASAELVAPVLAGEGELVAALDALIASGLLDQAARLLEGLPGSTLDRCNQRELLAILRLVQSSAPDSSQLRLKIARVHGNLQEINESVQACETVLAVATPGSPVWLEAASELLWYQHRTIGVEDAEQRLVALRDTIAAMPDSAAAATRLTEVEANILGQSPDSRTVQRAVELLEEVAASWERQGEPLRAARALRTAASGPLHHLGQYRKAQTMMGRAARLAVDQTFDFGLCQLVKARFDALCADREAFRQSHQLAQTIIPPTGIRWLEAHLHISAALDASWDTNGAEVDRNFRAARELFAPLHNTDAAVTLHADMAVLLAVSGNIRAAAASLDDVRSHANLNPVEFEIAEVVVAARSGQFATALRLWEDLDRSGKVPNDRRWRVLLELDLADPNRSSDRARVIRREVARLGLRPAAVNLHPDLWDSPTAEERISLHVHVLGGFRILSNGEPLELPGTKTADLVKLLVVSERSAAVESIAHFMWPDADAALGAQRLRNIVKRTRDVLGHDAILRVDDRLVLADYITSDLEDFSQAALRAEANMTFDPQLARAAAMQALDLYLGPLLPTDQLADQISNARTAVGRTATRLLSYVTRNNGNPAWLAQTQRRTGLIENDEAGSLD